MGADSIYERLVAKAGLYGKAFFGHKASKAEKAKLQRLWLKALKQANEEMHHEQQANTLLKGSHSRV